MHKFIYDSRLAFAQKESRLQVYQTEVDHDGFDIIFDDGELLRKLQVKTVLGTKRQWEINRGLLRPTISSADYFGFESSQEGIGIEGGVILQKLEVKNNDLTIKYLYTDLYIIRAFELGIIKRKNAKAQGSVSKLFHNLKQGKANSKLVVYRNAFLSAKGSSELLTLAGFNCGLSGSWLSHLKDISALNGGFVKTDDIKLAMPEEKLKKYVRDEILILSDEKDLT